MLCYSGPLSLFFYPLSFNHHIDYHGFSHHFLMDDSQLSVFNVYLVHELQTEILNCLWKMYLASLMCPKCNKLKTKLYIFPQTVSFVSFLSLSFMLLPIQPPIIENSEPFLMLLSPASPTLISCDSWSFNLTVAQVPFCLFLIIS